MSDLGDRIRAKAWDDIPAKYRKQRWAMKRTAEWRDIALQVDDALEADRKIASDFIQAIYAGPVERVHKFYDNLPQWIKDAILAAPIYNEEEPDE